MTMVSRHCLLPYLLSLLVAVLVFWGLGFLLWVVGSQRTKGPVQSTTIQTLIMMSEQGEPLNSRLGSPNAELTPAEVSLALTYLYAHPDASSYHLLLNIRKLDLVEYSKIPKFIKAGILTEALGRTDSTDDWGDVNNPIYVPEAGTALLEVGEIALPWLFGVLEHENCLGSMDGETGAWCESCQWRRKDVAYRYINLILSRRPFFSPDPKKRDEAIKQLKKQMDYVLRP
jgi:hypothetical protein